MTYMKLYDTERLICVDDNVKKEYWVLRTEGVSPLTTKHKVKNRYIDIAKAIFLNHPQGIETIPIAEMHYQEGKNWKPQRAVENKVETVDK